MDPKLLFNSIPLNIALDLIHAFSAKVESNYA
jgi:hypothetical protein